MFIQKNFDLNYFPEEKTLKKDATIRLIPVESEEEAKDKGAEIAAGFLGDTQYYPIAKDRSDLSDDDDMGEIVIAYKIEKPNSCSNKGYITEEASDTLGYILSHIIKRYADISRCRIIVEPFVDEIENVCDIIRKVKSYENEIIAD